MSAKREAGGGVESHVYLQSNDPTPSDSVLSFFTFIRPSIGTCPCCKFPIWARVELITEVRDAFLSSSGAPTTNASTRIAACEVEEHSCERDES